MKYAISLPNAVRSLNLENVKIPVRLPEHSASVTPKVAELARNLSRIMNDMLLSVIDQKTVQDFTERRDKVLPDYVKILRAQSDLIGVMIPDVLALAALVGEAFSEIETELEEQGVERFGSVVKDQAIFTIWTLRKTMEQIAKIWSFTGTLPEQLEEQDREICREYFFAAIWTQFHLHCLVLSMRFDKAIYPDLLPEITDGLRAAVNGYAAVRRGVDLRFPYEDPSVIPDTWDEEDQELLDSSMSEIGV
jgi:hypothetical protein